MSEKLSFTEENYLKAIYHLSDGGKQSVNTNSLAESMNTSPASANDMVKRLSQKKLIGHQKYKGATLEKKGEEIALKIIRKHRLWEVFLVEKLSFKWDQVHEIAEQLEHIQSPLLISRLDEFLGHPTVDPHGDPIPNEDGEMKQTIKAPISELPVSTKGIIVSVNNDDSSLLKHLNTIGIELGSKVEIVERMEFDGSVSVKVDEMKQQFISPLIADNLMVTVID